MSGGWFVGLDIHDGPLQVLATLVGTPASCGTASLPTSAVTRTAGSCSPGSTTTRCASARSTRIIRELALSLESQRLRTTDFVVVRDEAAAFAARTGIVVDIDVTGSFANLTASQRFAIAAVVREALANVREHGKASRARLRVCATTACIRASVTDDGRGFDVERALVAAAARGRLGLVGMSERLRLLGGHLAVDSRPGGPTKISMTLPRWESAKGLRGPGPGTAGTRVVHLLERVCPTALSASARHSRDADCESRRAASGSAQPAAVKGEPSVPCGGIHSLGWSAQSF